MKKIIFTTFFVLFVWSFQAASAQVMPPGSSDKNLDDRNIKERSIELERIKRDAEKNGNGQNNQAMINKFAEIKEDFEKIQILQSSIIASYTNRKQIDYAQISYSSEEMNKRAIRLKANLFPPPPIKGKKGDKKAKDKEKEPEPQPALPTEVKTLIVDLDNAIGSFSGNAMFVNPKLVDPKDTAKAENDLEKVIVLSAALKKESDNQKKNGT